MIRCAPLMLLVALGVASAQATKPIPAVLKTAKQVFVGVRYIRSAEATQTVYHATTQALAKDGYVVVDQASTADLLLEVSEAQPGPVVKGDSLQSNEVELTVYDRSTHALVWQLRQRIHFPVLALHIPDNIGEAAAKAVDDLKQLSQQAQSKP